MLGPGSQGWISPRDAKQRSYKEKGPSYRKGRESPRQARLQKSLNSLARSPTPSLVSAFTLVSHSASHPLPLQFPQACLHSFIHPTFVKWVPSVRTRLASGNTRTQCLPTDTHTDCTRRRNVVSLQQRAKVREEKSGSLFPPSSASTFSVTHSSHSASVLFLEH